MLFNTYLLRSGSLHGGHVGREFAPQEQGQDCLQAWHLGTIVPDWNPSFFVGSDGFSTYRPNTYPRVKIKTRMTAINTTFTRIVGPLYSMDGFMLSIRTNLQAGIHKVQAEKCLNCSGVGCKSFGHCHATSNRDLPIEY